MSEQKPRRRKGDGGLFKTTINGKEGWVATWHDGNGKLRRAYGASDQEALARKAKRIQISYFEPPSKPKRKTVGTPINPTLSQFMEDYLTSGTEAAEESKAKYRHNITTHVLPLLGNKPVKRIETADITTWLNRMRTKKIGDSAIQHTFKHLKAVFTYAVNCGIIDKNPMAPIKSPKADNHRAAYIDMNIDSHVRIVMGILNWMQQPECEYRDRYPLILTMLLGLRREEALGLCQSSLIPEPPQLKIQYRLKQRIGGGMYLEYATKNNHTRVIPLPPAYYNVLSEQERKSRNITQPVQVLISNDTEGTENPIFIKTDGRPLSYNDWNNGWREVQDAYQHYVWGEEAEPVSKKNRLYIEPHEMRHIFATMLAESDVPMAYAQSLLGHLTPSMTEHYTHILESKQKTIMTKVQEGISESMKVMGFVDGVNHEAAMMKAAENQQETENAQIDSKRENRD